MEPPKANAKRNSRLLLYDPKAGVREIQGTFNFE